MFHHFDKTQTDRGDSLVGWQIECVQLADGQTVVPIFSDENSTAITTISGITNRAVSDEVGDYDFFVEDGTYSLRFYNEVGEFQKSQRYLPMYGSEAAAGPEGPEGPEGPQGPAGDLSTLPDEVLFQKKVDWRDTKAEIAAIDNSVTRAAILAEDGTVWFWSATVPIATHVADAVQENYIAPDAAAIGAWQRSPLIVNDPELLEISANGWEAIINNPDDLSLEDVTISSPGFDTSGVATIHTRTLQLGKQVRDVFPDNATLLEDRQALTDYVYTGDVIGGVVNSSTVVSPKPQLAWVMPSRLMTPTTCTWEIQAAHRDARADGSGAGRQVACVKVRANDGTTQTAWETVSTTVASTYIEGPTNLEVYTGSLDVSGLTGTYWLEAEGYPWFGGASSVEKSEDNESAGGTRREFTRRYFSKGTAPAYCAVESTGDDSTGAANASEATAETTPCLTVGGALKKLHDLLGTGSNALDGAEIIIKDAVSMGSVPYTGSYKQQGGAGVLIRRSTSATRAAAEVTMSGSIAPDFDTPIAPVTEGGLVLNDITLVHTGGSLVGIGGAQLDVQIWNVDYDGSTTAGRSNSHFSLFGVDYTAGYGANLTASGGDDDRQVRIMRGVTIATPSPVLESWITVGCLLEDPTLSGANAGDRGFVFGNQFQKTNSATINFSPANGDTLTVAIIGNIFEFTGSDDSQTTIQICANGGNSSHVVIHHNAITGAYQAGRNNIFYDGFANGDGSLQTHDLASVKGNILPQINYKGDVFNSSAVNVGYFPIMHGVGFEGNFIQFLPNAPTTESADYNGLGSVNASSNTVRNDPLFTDYQGSTNVGTTVTAGAGGGDYTLAGGSPARDLLSGPLLAFDIAGASRATGTQDAGAYA